jgi:hypothetical protein
LKTLIVLKLVPFQRGKGWLRADQKTIVYHFPTWIQRILWVVLYIRLLSVSLPSVFLRGFFSFFFKKVENLGSTFEIHLQNFPAFPKSLSTVSSPTNRLPPTDTVPSLALSLSLYENRFLLRSGFNYSRKKRHSILNPRSTLKRHLRSKGVGHGEQQQR